MFVDGVRDFGGYSRDSFNLEQVEVAKGPPSGIAGRGSTGGAINQVSKAPRPGATYDGSHRRRQRRLRAGRRSTSTSRSRAAGHRRPAERDVDRRRRPRPRRGREPALGRGTVDRVRPGHADARDARATSTSGRTTCRSTACPGCRPTPTPSWRRTRTAGRRWIRAISTA